MKALLILIFLNTHLEVLQYKEGDTHTVLLMDRECMDEVRRTNKGECLPIDKKYFYNTTGN